MMAGSNMQGPSNIHTMQDRPAGEIVSRPRTRGHGLIGAGIRSADLLQTALRGCRAAAHC